MGKVLQLISDVEEAIFAEESVENLEALKIANAMFDGDSVLRGYRLKHQLRIHRYQMQHQMARLVRNIQATEVEAIPLQDRREVEQPPPRLRAVG